MSNINILSGDGVAAGRVSVFSELNSNAAVMKRETNMNVYVILQS